MSRKACLTISLKLVTLATFLLGACIIITCGLTLFTVSTQSDETPKKEKEELTTPSSTLPLTNESKNLREIRNTNNKKNGVLEFELGNSTSTTEHETEVQLETRPKNKSKFFPKFPKLDRNYKLILVICLSVAIIAGFIQMISSMFTLSSCSKKVKNRTKMWLGLHIFVFLVFLTCIAVPLSYHPEKGERIKIGDFTSHVKSQMKTLTEGNSSILDKLRDKLTGYYVVLGFNEAFLFLSILSLCICKKCVKNDYEPIR